MKRESVARRVLVIGYGNELRGDDGIGAHLARAAAARWPQVRALAVHQLTPELAEAVADASRVIFVDARATVEGEPVQVCRVEPRWADGALGHTGDARTILALARDLFDQTPPAWRVTVTAPRLDLGESLSAEALAHVQTALERIAELL
jgi:hydrogenase maturation protease